MGLSTASASSSDHTRKFKQMERALYDRFLPALHVKLVKELEQYRVKLIKEVLEDLQYRELFGRTVMRERPPIVFDLRIEQECLNLLVEIDTITTIHGENTKR